MEGMAMTALTDDLQQVPQSCSGMNRLPGAFHFDIQSEAKIDIMLETLEWQGLTC
jgi:hypothetical protein